MWSREVHVFISREWQEERKNGSDDDKNTIR